MTFSFCSFRGIKTDHSAEEELWWVDTAHCVFECEGCRLLAVVLIRFLLGAPMETAATMVTVCAVSLVSGV